MFKKKDLIYALYIQYSHAVIYSKPAVPKHTCSADRVPIFLFLIGIPGIDLLQIQGPHTSF